MPELDWSKAPIHQEIKADWTTPEILIEGSLNCGKTTVGLDKEIDAILKWPGIRILFFRWIDDDVKTKLKPDLDVILDIRGLTPEWNATEKCYEFDNGSRAYLFGLKTQNSAQIFSKIRGLGVSRLLGDQVEEVKPSVAGELRGRLRPNLKATVRGQKFPFQLTFISNTEDFDFWLSKQFPLDNHIAGRRVYSLSVYDNPYLPKESIESLLREFPEDHPKFLTMVMGQRGPNITGDPIFASIYNKEIHWRPIAIAPDRDILESFEFGTHNPTWVFAQSLYAGGLSVLGGIRGAGMALEDFFDVIKPYRSEWLDDYQVKTCVSPMGDTSQSIGQRYTPISVMKRLTELNPVWRENGNAPDVRLALIENISSYLRRRNAFGVEAFGVNKQDERFLIISKEDGVKESPFMHHALSAGYVWDESFKSVSHKEVKQPREDDKFANAMHCLENIELNFCAGKPTGQDKAKQKSNSRRKSQRIVGGEHSWMA